MASFPRRHCEMCKQVILTGETAYALRRQRIRTPGRLEFWLCEGCGTKVKAAVKAMA